MYRSKNNSNNKVINDIEKMAGHKWYRPTREIRLMWTIAVLCLLNSKLKFDWIKLKWKSCVWVKIVTEKEETLEWKMSITIWIADDKCSYIWSEWLQTFGSCHLLMSITTMMITWLHKCWLSRWGDILLCFQNELHPQTLII